MVSLLDSRNAGNCLQGSLVFAEKRLKMNRDDLIKGGYLVHVSAAKLVKTGDERAIRAAKIAWARETTISI